MKSCSLVNDPQLWAQYSAMVGKYKLWKAVDFY